MTRTHVAVLFLIHEKSAPSRELTIEVIDLGPGVEPSSGMLKADAVPRRARHVPICSPLSLHWSA